MRKTILLTGIFLVTILVLNQELSAQPDQRRTRYFCGNGQVVSVDGDRLGITIAHQTIDGYMPAMTMHFKAADVEVLTGITASDRVRFVLKDTPDLTRLIYIEKLAPEPRRRRKR